MVLKKADDVDDNFSGDVNYVDAYYGDDENFYNDDDNDDDDDGNDSEESMGAHTRRSADVKAVFLPATIKWFCHQHHHQHHQHCCHHHHQHYHHYHQYHLRHYYIKIKIITNYNINTRPSLIAISIKC